MKMLRRAMVAVAGLLLAAGACRAQGLDSIWSDWETSAVERHGPQLAGGLLLYFHGYSSREDVTRDPIPIIFTAMAKTAKWDVLRINRHRDVDVEAEDDHILQVVADRIARARQDGYRRIIVAGASRGGWLALLAATLPDVDAAIGLAPGTTSYEPEALKRTLGVLAQRLAAARARRVAAFFFEGDPLERLDEPRAVSIRHALQASGSAFMVIDRPPDLPGHSAGATGRFVRRYRDCLLRFVRSDDEPAGEVQCSTSSGYAVGSEIGFPAPAFSLKNMPADGDPVFAPFWGRWEGDDEWGNYLIIEAVAAGPKTIVFQMGFSGSPERGVPWTDWMMDVPFEFDHQWKCIYLELPTRDGMIVARLRSATELDYGVPYQDLRQDEDLRHAPVWKSRIVLRKRSSEAGNPQRRGRGSVLK